MTIVVNLFGGPGTGKTVTALLLTSLLKMRGYNAEYVSEFAKTIVWEERYEKLKDQDFILKGTNDRLKILENKVDFIIFDGSILSAIYYEILYNGTITDELREKVLKTYNSYNNANIFLKKNKDIPYEKEGRTQNEEESEKIAKGLNELLDNMGYKYYEFEPVPFQTDITKTHVQKIYELIT